MSGYRRIVNIRAKRALPHNPFTYCRVVVQPRYNSLIRHTSGTVPNPLMGSNNPALRDHAVFGTLCRVGIAMANRYGHKLTCRQIAEATLVR